MRRDTIDLQRPMHFVFNILYGTRCPVCGRRRSADDGGLCDACRQTLTPGDAPRCVRCAVKLGPHVPVEGRCSYCRTLRFGFRSACAAFDYEGPVRRLIHAVKFDRQWTVSRRLASAFVRGLPRDRIPPETDVVVPVPMFWWDRRVRGVHLAGVLSKQLAATHGIAHEPSLLRQLRPARPQSGLTAAERYRNVRGLFAVQPGTDLHRRRVLLVDDVLTTGATASACARALRKAGAKEVHVALLARTPPPDVS